MQWYSVVVLMTFVAAVAAQMYYTGKWNHVNTHEIIDNKRIFDKYKSCIIRQIPTGCPQDALELRRILPEVLEEECAKCSPEQVAKIKDTLAYICLKRADAYQEILRHIDPNNEFLPKFEAKHGKIDGQCKV